MNKCFNLPQAGAAKLQSWLIPRNLSGFCLVTMLCLLTYIYAVLCLTDMYSAYVIKTNEQAFVNQTQQLASVTRQLELLEQAIKQREIKHEQLYNSVLLREGRLTERHITDVSASRLVAGTVNRGSSVNRSHFRYSPYQFDITIPSAVTAYELEKFLSGTELDGLGRSFVQAELLYGINAMFLTALAIHESSWGNSEIARVKHNLFGFAAYDSDPYRFAHSFDSKPECVLHVARFIREQYIEGSLSQGRNIADINRKYASDPEWSHKVLRLMMQIDDTIRGALISS